MIVSIDVGYSDAQALAVAVLFENWGDAIAADVYTAKSPLSAESDYQPGQFYKRELNPILDVLTKTNAQVEMIIIDGYVILADQKPGLGMHLYHSLTEKTPIIGVAKNAFFGAPHLEVVRGESTKPLYVTSIGIETEQAAMLIKKMHGPYRLPTLLKLADSLTKQ